MEQIYRLQRQIQDLQQEVHSISQVAGQLQRSEANHAAQLQQMSQYENSATQQLQTIQQLCSRLSQEVSAISSMAQQIPQMVGMQTGSQLGSGFYSSQPSTGQFGSNSPTISTGQYSAPTFGTFGSQFGGGRSDQYAQNQQTSQMAANRSSMGFTGNMANQGMLGAQNNLAVTPAHPISHQNMMPQSTPSQF